MKIFQGFTNGTTEIQFDVSLTQNTAIGTPDGFEIAVLDGNTFQIPTDSPDTLSLVVANIGVGPTTLNFYKTTDGSDVIASAP